MFNFMVHCMEIKNLLLALSSMPGSSHGRPVSSGGSSAQQERSTPPTGEYSMPLVYSYFAQKHANVSL